MIDRTSQFSCFPEGHIEIFKWAIQQNLRATPNGDDWLRGHSIAVIELFSGKQSLME